MNYSNPTIANFAEKPIPTGVDVELDGYFAQLFGRNIVRSLQTLALTRLPEADASTIETIRREFLLLVTSVVERLESQFSELDLLVLFLLTRMPYDTETLGPEILAVVNRLRGNARVVFMRKAEDVCGTFDSDFDAAQDRQIPKVLRTYLCAMAALRRDVDFLSLKEKLRKRIEDEISAFIEKESRMADEKIFQIDASSRGEIIHKNSNLCIKNYYCNSLEDLFTLLGMFQEMYPVQEKIRDFSPNIIGIIENFIRKLISDFNRLCPNSVLKFYGSRDSLRALQARFSEPVFSKISGAEQAKGADDVHGVDGDDLGDHKLLPFLREQYDGMCSLLVA